MTKACVRRVCCIPGRFVPYFGCQNCSPDSEMIAVQKLTRYVLQLVFYGTAIRYRTLTTCTSGFETCGVLRRDITRLPNPQFGGPGLRIYDPRRQWPRYTPRIWVARDFGSATSRTLDNCESQRRYVLYVHA
jgi:hypothetical protein